MGERANGAHITHVREAETWWWIDSPSHGYGVSEVIARRAQRIYGGRVEVIRQTITTVTTTTVVAADEVDR
jgi:hypothetical protein